MLLDQLATARLKRRKSEPIGSLMNRWTAAVMCLTGSAVQHWAGSEMGMRWLSGRPISSVLCCRSIPSNDWSVRDFAMDIGRRYSCVRFRDPSEAFS